MKKFKFDKLIRDKVLDCMEGRGQRVHLKKMASQSERLQYYKEKLVEEAQEVHDAVDHAELIEELGDLSEVFAELLNQLSIEPAEVEKARLEKKGLKGGFKEGFVVDYVEVDPSDPWIQYYLDKPDRYPSVEDALEIQE